MRTSFFFESLDDMDSVEETELALRREVEETELFLLEPVVRRRFLLPYGSTKVDSTFVFSQTYWASEML